MGEIFEMPQGLREKIAAGEVITSPVSVVKELVENSIDAGASEIRVYFENGGKRVIRVVDDGNGMDRDDLAICCKRFTTSKIRSEKELERICTLGFRGEALASIATVSELTIQTRKKGADKGYISEFHDDGRAVEIKESPITKGTIVEVRNLFGKFPVRLKFLKSDEVEASKITSLITKYSLVSENISFRVFKDGKEIFNSPKGNYTGKIFHAFGQEIAENVVPVWHSADGAMVNGYISKVGYSRKTRDYQVIFINGRLVRDNPVMSAVEKGFADKIFLGRHPIAILHITLDPGAIDVNIHPSKDEVKFRNDYVITDAVINAVQKSIAGSSHAINTEMGGKMAPAVHRYEMSRGTQTMLMQDEERQILARVETPEKAAAARPGEEFLRISLLGQVNKTYILGHDSNGLVLIDQHAAQERVFYEKFTGQLKGKAILVNKLLKPFIFLTSREDEKFIEQNKEVLGRYGFYIEPFGKNEYALTTVPAIFGRAYDASVVRDVIDELRENIDSGTAISEELDHKIATRACRKAVKGGDELTIPEASALLAALAKCKNPYTCPHGRPTILRMSWGDIEKKFKRSE